MVLVGVWMLAVEKLRFQFKAERRARKSADIRCKHKRGGKAGFVLILLIFQIDFAKLEFKVWCGRLIFQPCSK